MDTKPGERLRSQSVMSLVPGRIPDETDEYRMEESYGSFKVFQELPPSQHLKEPEMGSGRSSPYVAKDPTVRKWR